MECSSMLESKIVNFTSFEDIIYFLGSSNANSPQKLSKDFILAYSQLLNREIRDNNAKNIGVLVKVLDHIVKQDCDDVMKVLISYGFHNNFGTMIGFAYDQISSKKVMRSFGDQLFLTLLRALFQYARKINNSYEWLFQNMLHRLLEIIAEPSVYYNIRLQTVEMLLNLFSPDEQEVVSIFRSCINENQKIFDMLCEKAFKSLSVTGDSQLQESIVELIFRMWSTSARTVKATKWWDGNQQLLSKFLAISYDKFDYGVRMLLNAVNSGYKRRVLTLNYKELRVGSQTLIPSNQWCNCVDFCYGSKVLSVRFPTEEASEQNNCSWNINTITATNLTSFFTAENTALRTIDLHIEFGTLSSQILKDFTLEDELATNLIIRFYRQPPLDAQLLNSFACTLFGRKYANVQGEATYDCAVLIKHVVQSGMRKASNEADKPLFKHSVARPKKSLILNARSCTASSQDIEKDDTMNISHISILSHKSLSPTQFTSQNAKSSQRSQAVNQVVRQRSVFPDFVSTSLHRSKQSFGSDEAMQMKINVSRSQKTVQSEQERRLSKPSFEKISSRQPYVDLKRSQSIDCLSRPCTPSQITRQNTMMNNLAIHAVKESDHTTSSVQQQFASMCSLPSTSITPASSRTNISQPSKRMLANTSELSLPKPLSDLSPNMANSLKNAKLLSQTTRKSSQSSALEIDNTHSENDFKALPRQARSANSKSITHSATSKLAYLDKSSKSYFSDAEKISSIRSKYVNKLSSINEANTANSSERSQVSSKNLQKNTTKKNKNTKIDTRPLSEILQETGNTTLKWDDVIPETQGFLNVSADTNPSNLSIDLMLSCLKPTKESVTDSKKRNAKSKLSTGLISVPRRITRSSGQASQKLNDSISPAFPSLTISNKNENTRTNNEDGKKVDMNNNAEKEKVLTSEQPTRARTKTSAVANKVNAEFESKKVDNGKENKKPGILSTRKKKRSLINTDMVEPLDYVSSGSTHLSSAVDNMIMKSIKKKPFAAKFMKSSTDASKSSRKSDNGKKKRKPTVVEIFKTDTECETGGQSDTGLQIDDDAPLKTSMFGNVLKTLNIGQRPGGLEKTKSVEVEVKKIQKGKRTKKPAIELPFAEIEEIPTIDILDDDLVFQPIDTVRDAPMIEDIAIISSPEPILAPRKKSCSRIFDTTESSDTKQAKRKRPRVSFNGLSSNTDDENNDFNRKGKEKKTKRSKKARLFDSTSDAASAASSDLSWIKMHRNKAEESPRLLKKYSSKKILNVPLNFSFSNSLINNPTMDCSTYSSSSPEAVRGGDVGNNSLMSGITRLQSLASACNLTFDDIALMNTKETTFDAEATEVSPVKLVAEPKNSPTFDWNNDEAETDKELNDIQPTVQSLDLTAWEDVPLDEIYISSTDEKDKNRKMLEKVLPPKALELARLNNNTPIETSERLLYTREKIANNKPTKRKADIRDSPGLSSTFLNKAEYKSKKKLNMRSSETPSYSNQSLNESTRSHGTSKKMIKLMGKFIRDVDCSWREGDQQRDKYLQSFAEKAVECETHHNRLIKDLKSLESETKHFITKFNSKVDVVMTEAAKNIVEVKGTYSRLVKRLHHSNSDQNIAMERLRGRIYDELKEIIQNSDC